MRKPTSLGLVTVMAVSVSACSGSSDSGGPVDTSHPSGGRAATASTRDTSSHAGGNVASSHSTEKGKGGSSATSHSTSSTSTTGGTGALDSLGSSAAGGLFGLGGAASAGGATAMGGQGSMGTGPGTSIGGTEFAPYFYTWGWGNKAYPFTGLADLKGQASLSSVTLAFVLSNGKCAVTTDIQEHLSDVDAFRKAGGHVKASFGGANGTYLENACTDAESMAKAILGFVADTGITDLDFDVEQAGAMDATVNARRAQALKLVQTEKDVDVSYTLAATPRDKWDTPGGLSAASLAVVKTTLDAKVKITRVNLMTMDYGSYYSDGKAMGALAISALADAATQLKTIIPGLNDSEAYHLLGATPMIGENDAEGEVFTLEDARTLITYAKEKGLGLVAFWAINRDQACPYNDLAVCSKVNKKAFEFSDIFRGAEATP